MPADSPELMQQITDWAKIVLEWVGFGTLTGLLAKAIMPGKDPGGAVATLAMGIGGILVYDIILDIDMVPRIGSCH